MPQGAQGFQPGNRFGGGQPPRGGSNLFQPGQSANPGGRRKPPEHVRKLAEKHTVEAINTLAKIMRHGTIEGSRVNAAVALLDRAWGKAPQALVNEDGSPLQIQAVLFAALRENRPLPAPYIDAAPQHIAVETVKP